MKKEIIVMIYVLVFVCLVICAMGYGAVRYVLVPYPSNINTAPLTDQEVQIKSHDKLTLTAAKIYNKRATHKWAIVVHSYRTNKENYIGFGNAYLDSGYNILMPDNRAHGKSEGEFIGMGWLDKDDLLQWVNYIIEEDPKAIIILHGISMGGSAVMMLSGIENLPENIKILIEDSGYVSADEYLTWKLKQKFHLPAFPIIPIANAASKYLAGYYLSEASAVSQLEKCKIPIMFIHGKKDKTVSVNNVYLLFDTADCEKELYVVEEADHDQNMRKDPKTYWNKVFNFINTYVN